MRPAEISALIKPIFDQYPEIEIAILFGSAGKSRLTPASDIDLAVAARQPLSYTKKNNLQVALSRALHHEVDLIDLNAVSGTILQQVLCTGTVILKNNPSLFAFLLKKMWFNQADMMPLTKMVMKKHCLRFVNG